MKKTAFQLFSIPRAPVVWWTRWGKRGWKRVKMFTVLQPHSQRYYHFISTTELTNVGLLSFGLVQFQKRHLFLRVFKCFPTLEPTSALLYLYFVLLWYWMWIRAGSSWFLAVSTVTCPLCFYCPDPPEAPSAVYLSVSSSTSLRVDFQEPLSVNSAVVTKYKGQQQQ